MRKFLPRTTYSFHKASSRTYAQVLTPHEFKRVKVGPTSRNRYTNSAIQSMIRVDLAGEKAACRICKTQLWWMSPLNPNVKIVQEILEQEIHHREIMEALSAKYGASETIFDPIFKVATIGLGLYTSMMGTSTIMCCHAAVEEAITAHYNDQLRELIAMRDPSDEADEDDDVTNNESATLTSEKVESNETEGMDEKEKTIRELRTIITVFRNDEMHHQELGEVNGAADAPFYPIVYPAIKQICAIGISLAERW